MKDDVKEIKSRVEKNRENIINFMREICAIPSMDGQLKEVGDRIGAEMTKLGFDEVRFDKMGNIMGRIGSGNRVVVYDSHVDTVGIGDLAQWQWDPFKGKVEDGILLEWSMACPLQRNWVCLRIHPRGISATWKNGVTASRPTPSLKWILVSNLILL